MRAISRRSAHQVSIGIVVGATASREASIPVKYDNRMHVRNISTGVATDQVQI